MVYVLRHIIRLRNHIAASVDEKGRREGYQISWTDIGTHYVERMDSSLAFDVQATTSRHVLLNKYIMHLIK